MRTIYKEELLLSGPAILFAGISPNVFPVAQAGFESMSVLGCWVLLPSVLMLALAPGIAAMRADSCR